MSKSAALVLSLASFLAITGCTESRSGPATETGGTPGETASSGTGDDGSGTGEPVTASPAAGRLDPSTPAVLVASDEDDPSRDDENHDSGSTGASSGASAGSSGSSAATPGDTASWTLDQEGDEPGDPVAEIARAESLRKQGHYDQAFDALAAARRMKSSDTVRAEALYSLAETHFRFGQEADWDRLEFGLEADPYEQFALARDRYRELEQRFPMSENAATARYMQGSCWLLLGDQATALGAYQRAYEVNPTVKEKARALMRVGVCYTGIGDAKGARAAWETYLRDYGKHPDVGNAPQKIRGYLTQLALIGRQAAPIVAASWLYGVIPNGLRDLRGEVTVLVFFSTGCPHCKKEMPRLKRDLAKYTKDGVVYVGICDPEDEHAEDPIDVYVRRNDLPFFDVAVDPGGRTQRPYQVSGFPAAVLIDKRGTIRWRGHYAFFPTNLLETLLAEKL